jgi:hypothetical protein
MVVGADAPPKFHRICIGKSEELRMLVFGKPLYDSRLVQKPQFLNNFPEKNREFAAMCGKFSRLGREPRGS